MLVIEAVSHLLQDPWMWETYLPERRAYFDRQWQIIQQAMKMTLPSYARVSPIHGGLNAWISFGPAEANAKRKERTLQSMLQAEGIHVMPGFAYRLEEAEDQQTLRSPGIRFPLSPWGTREMLHALARISAALHRL